MKNLLLAGLGLAVLGSSNMVAGQNPPAAGRERVELAKQIYRERIINAFARRLDPPALSNAPSEDPLINEAMAETLHRWSVRWMEAESDLAADKAGRTAAAQAHLERMKVVERGGMVRKELADHPLVKELDAKKNPLVDAGVAEILQLDDARAGAARRYSEVARYFRLEAEALLADEKAKR